MLKQFNKTSLLLGACSLLFACDSSKTKSQVGGGGGNFLTEEHSAQHPPTGGMWMPEQIPQLKDLLKKLGLAIDPQELSDPTSKTLNAIVSLGGCSGSFVSELGLIITNHHCVSRYLNYMTQVDRQNGNPNADYVKHGYFAPSQKEERFTGPESRVYITTEIIDVTEKLTEGLAAIEDPLKRYQEQEKRQKALLKEAESSGKNIKAEISSFFKGEKYYLTKKLELKDLRMVYAPPEAVGFFGGDEKNWEFPRHVGDFAFLRIYTGDNSNEPAETNKPYKPQNILKVAKEALKDKDLILVAGYPGRTNRLSTYAESSDDYSVGIPTDIQVYLGAKKLFDDLAAQSDELRVKTESTRFGINNVLKKQQEALKMLEEIKYVEGKKDLQDKLVAWINADEARKAKYGDALEKLEALRQNYRAGWKERLEVARPFNRSFNPLLNAAANIARLAKEKEKPDAERSPEYQERKWKDLRDRVKGLQGAYSREVTREVTTTYVSQVLKHDQVPAYIKESYDLSDSSLDSIRNQTQKMLEATELENLDKRLALFDNATWAQLQQTTDPIMKMAVNAVDLIESLENHEKAYSGDQSLVVGLYIKALREFLASRGQLMAPDANSTLRVTFGLIEGYFSSKYNKFLEPFTNFKQLIEEEHTPGKKDFECPQAWLDAYEKVKQHGYGPYAVNNELQLNFVANVDTTGGNSGSAALNAKGELVGLLFDGNSETLYGDYRFDKKIRSILVDVRYAIWTLDQIVGAKDLLKEMGLEPAFDGALGNPIKQ